MSRPLRGGGLRSGAREKSRKSEEKPGWRFRAAAPLDLERLLEIHHAAYPDPLSVQARLRNFTHNPFGGFEYLIVVEDRSGIVGHAFLFPLRAWFGGRAVKVGAIASVGVAPEARGRGTATALMNHLHHVSDRRGDALTMLYAFRQGYYARLDYATTSSRKRLAIDTRSVPSSWRDLARSRVRALGADEGVALRRLHARAAEKSSGWIERPKRLWETLFAREQRMILLCENPSARRGKKPDLTGYVAFNLVQERANAETVIEVDELVADDAPSRRALLGGLSAMRDQATEIVLEVADGDPLERALVDADGRRFGTESVAHSLGEIVAGPMVRIENVARALAARGYLDRGTFDLAVRSSVDGEPDMKLSVVVRDGRAKVAPPQGGACLRTSRAGLAAIFYGALSVTDAVALGMAEAEPGLMSRIDAIARIPPLTPMDAF